MEHSPPNSGTSARKPAAYCLSLHSDYQCRHAGACCTAGWAIPVEGPTFERLTVHFGRESTGDPLFVTGGPLPAGAAAILGVRSNGACVFFEEDRGRLCTVHRELGSGMLPTACRQFPRVVLQDARGTFITLSHFCPTAAALLRSPRGLEIVPAPANLALDGALEGLDARGALPPLLAPGMLTDDEGYAAWEMLALGVFARDDLTAEEAIEVVAAATRLAQSWRPGGRSLRDAVEGAFAAATPERAAGDLDDDIRRMCLAVAAVPHGLTPPPVLYDFASRWPSTSAWWRDHDGIIRRYLAARLFGNWIAYYGPGLHAIVEYLRISLSVLKMEAARRDASSMSAWPTLLEAVRAADLLMVHLADTRSLVRRL
jgi:Fe-S-cluster containining protein